MRFHPLSLLMAAAVAASGPPGLADPVAASSAPPPREVAQQIIKAAQAEDMFESVEAAGMAAVRHRKSGLLCLFFPDGGHNRISMNTSASLPRGDDLTCNTNAGSMNLYVFGARYDASVTVDSQTARLTSDLSKALGQGTIQPGPVMPGEHPWRFSIIKGALSGKAFEAYAIVGQVNGWTVSLVCIAPPVSEPVCRQTLAGLTEAELRSMWARAKQPA